MSFQAYLDNAEQITGRTPQQLVDEAELRHTTGSHRDESGTLRTSGAGSA